MTDITRLTRRYVDNILHVNIFGLNIFAANNVIVEPKNDPRYILLKGITESYCCALHFGVMAFEGDPPQEYLNVPEESFSLINTGIYGGTFYSVPEEQNGYYFDDANELWKGGQLSNILYTSSCDAIAVYAGIDRADSARRLGMMDKCIANSTEWIDLILEVADFIVLSAADNWHFEVLSKDDGCLETISRNVALAEASIRSSLWYQENRARLNWEADYDICLKLPQQMPI